MSADAEFAGLAREYLDDRAERHPDVATGLGDHRFDACLADPSAQARGDERRALDGWAARLAAVDDGALSAEHRVDAAMMADSVARRVFELDELREHTWNPLQANPGKAIYQLLARDFAPLPDRLASVAGRLAAVPAVLAGAGRQLGRMPGSTSRPRSGSSTARSRWSAASSRPCLRLRPAAAPNWPECDPPRSRRWPSTGPGCSRSSIAPMASPIRGSGRNGSAASCRSP